MILCDLYLLFKNVKWHKQINLKLETGNIPLYFIAITSRNSMLYGPFEDFSKISYKTFQFLRTLPKISEDFSRILKNH